MNTLERRLRVMSITIALLVLSAISCDSVSLAESSDTVIAHVEAGIRARFEHIAKYAVGEHYAVYRNGAAETTKQPPNRRFRSHISNVHLRNLMDT
jgi:hypothetical protein